MQARELCCLHRIIIRNFRVKQRNLFLDRTGRCVKMLLYAAKQMPFLLIRNIRRLASHNAHAALLRAVQPHQQLEQR